MAEVEHLMGIDVVRVPKVCSDNTCRGCVFDNPVFEDSKLRCEVLDHLEFIGQRKCYDDKTRDETIFVPPGLADKFTAYAVARRLEGAK